MPTVHRPKSGNWKVTMYFGDHNPPHFHVVYRGGEAIFEIETLRIIGGSVPATMRKAALKWAAGNKNSLLAKWNELHE